MSRRRSNAVSTADERGCGGTRRRVPARKAAAIWSRLRTGPGDGNTLSVMPYGKLVERGERGAMIDVGPIVAIAKTNGFTLHRSIIDGVSSTSPLKLALRKPVRTNALRP